MAVNGSGGGNWIPERRGQKRRGERERAREREKGEQARREWLRRAHTHAAAVRIMRAEGGDMLSGRLVVVVVAAAAA